MLCFLDFRQGKCIPSAGVPELVSPIIQRWAHQRPYSLHGPLSLKLFQTPPLLRMPISLKELTSDWNQKQPFECLKQEKRTRLRVNRSGTSNVMGKHVLDLCLSSAPLKTMTITERRAGRKNTNDRPGRRNVFEPKIGRQRK